MSEELKELQSRTNIHDYLERIGAKPPPVDPNELKKAQDAMIRVGSIEEAVDVILALDTPKENV